MRAEQVRAALEGNDRPVIVELKGVETIVVSKHTVALFFDDETNIKFLAPHTAALTIKTDKLEEVIRA